MTRVRLASLAAYAGDKLHPEGPAGPLPFSPDISVRARNVVYLVCGWSGKILYVGSTTVGVRTRFSQHLGSLTKTLDWASVYIIPLTDGTSERDVRRIEGRIGLAVGPERNKALPRIAVDC
ncbi:hypothetical protein LUPAC06_00155 [Micromonospora saelicesensis]|uniref:GIY-YIG nuclease family protein n=1 Tax=Micromonospora saelicesensis TaxID=285676 RepID=UPI000DBFAE4A|nr:GIY-YIG nuclease family protein [Micromonospora saelicesensis]RAO63429.1 hypothetical protein LUPAC06_00155 [Micromonospora saelicesensis]